MDKIDNKLISELFWNCRQPHTILAKKLLISKQVVRYRIRKLEDERIIKSYHALIDWRALGYNSVRIYLKWHNITPEIEEQIYQELKADPFFMWTVKFEGEFDIAFYIWIKNIPEFSKQWSAWQKRYKAYIQKIEMCESVEMIHGPLKCIGAIGSYEEKSIGLSSSRSYDEIDYKILQILTKNAQTPLIDIAGAIKLTAKAALYRIKKLEEKKIICGYNALIDTDRLGYNFYKIDFYLRDLSRLREMNEFSRQHKNIIYRMNTVGGPDFEIEVMVKNAVEMKTIVNEIRKRFNKEIETYRFHRFEYTIKQIYLPGEHV